MDDIRFDNLTRRLAGRTSRRAVLKGTAAGIAGLSAMGAAVRAGNAATCVGAHKVCTENDCCDGFTCDEHKICIAAECGGQSATCETNDQCCFGYICGENKTCITAAECATAGGGCGGADELCCGDLVCGADNLCVAAGSDAGGVSSLPNTGAGSDRGGNGGWLAGGVIALGGALLGGGLLRERISRGEGSDPNAAR